MALLIPGAGIVDSGDNLLIPGAGIAEGSEGSGGSGGAAGGRCFWTHFSFDMRVIVPFICLTSLIC